MEAWHRPYICDGVLFVPLLTWIIFVICLQGAHIKERLSVGGALIINLGGLMLDASVSVAAAPCLSYVLAQGTLMFMFTPLNLEKILFSHVDAICFQKKEHSKESAMFLSVSLAIKLQYFKLECEVNELIFPLFVHVRCSDSIDLCVLLMWMSNLQYRPLSGKTWVNYMLIN